MGHSCTSASVGCIGPHSSLTHMKDSWVSVGLGCLVVVGLVGAAAGLPGYALRPLLPKRLLQDFTIDKRGFWDKRAAFPPPARDQAQVREQMWPLDELGPSKRGFGSMMPAYLLQMYRADQPLLNPTDLLSSTRPTSERGKSGYTSRG